MMLVWAIFILAIGAVFGVLEAYALENSKQHAEPNDMDMVASVPAVAVARWRAGRRACGAFLVGKGLLCAQHANTWHASMAQWNLPIIEVHLSIRTTKWPPSARSRRALIRLSKQIALMLPSPMRSDTPIEIAERIIAESARVR